jgi:hypothetical protein
MHGSLHSRVLHAAFAFNQEDCQHCIPITLALRSALLSGVLRGAVPRCRVYFHKTGESDTDYLVDHSIIMYLIDPAGDFVTFYGKCCSQVDGCGST